ncbi:hypothetical protein PHOSAC3_120737 [Mesotoga infera]|nr:hypothetical protein PHOSAC3_120737 [Mesotoga infera]
MLIILPLSHACSFLGDKKMHILHYWLAVVYAFAANVLSNLRAEKSNNTPSHS